MAMASSATLSIILYSFFLLSCFSNAKTTPKPKAFIFPITKDSITNQYYTTIQIGSKSTTLKVVLDLGGKFLWFYSLDYFNAASSYRPVICGSNECRIANEDGCIFCNDSPPVPGCTNNTCSGYALNPFNGNQVYSGLGQDVLRVASTRGAHYKVNKFTFQYSDPFLLTNMSSPTQGLIGLGRTRISLQAQLASAFKIKQKFTLCIPSSNNNGNLIIGEVAYNDPFQKISEESLITTPLIKNPVPSYGNEEIGNFTDEYFLNLKSIKVGDTTLIFNKTLLSIDKKTGEGGTNIRTVKAYTSLQKPIYTALVKEFVKATARMNITRVASVAPFSACFDSKTIRKTNRGPVVPTIDLVLQSKSVYWRFEGSSSMIGVSSKVMCLAFVEGQPNQTGPTTSIVVGGYQLQDHLLEFDVDSSRLGFSSSLLLHDTSCSQFKAA